MIPGHCDGAVDLFPRSNVGMRAVSRLRSILVATVLALSPACGGGKKENTTPTGGGGTAGGGGGDSQGMGGSSGNPADVDPEGGGGGDGTGIVVTDGGGGEDGAGGAGGASGGGGGPAAIEPPGLDKSPDEVKRLVAAYLKEGREAMRAGRHDDAIVAAGKALKEDEVNVPAMVLLAHAYYEKGYYDKAEAILDIALARPDGPRDPQLQFLRGLVYEKTDREDEAMEAYEKSVAANPDYKPGLINLGAMYLRNKRYRDAIEVYEKLTGSLGAASAVTYNNLGSAYRGYSVVVKDDKAQRNDYLKRAETAYKRAISADTKYGPAYYNMGLLYLDADPFPAPDGSDMDYLKRIEMARTYFREYRGLPGADFALVDEQDAVAAKLHEREVNKREKEAERERKRLERERKKREKEGGGEG